MENIEINDLKSKLNSKLDEFINDTKQIKELNAEAFPEGSLEQWVDFFYMWLCLEQQQNKKDKDGII